MRHIDLSRHGITTQDIRRNLPPAELYAEAIRDEQAKVLRTIRPMKVTEMIRGQFRGYREDPGVYLSRTFEDVKGYDDIVMLRDIDVESHCEHHMVPIIGVAHIAYLPDKKVVGLSKLARLLDVFAKRLQIQEKMTAQIANTINDVLKPQGVGVIIKAAHHCMATRGVHKADTDLVTSRMLGCFRDNALTRQEFLGIAV